MEEPKGKGILAEEEARPGVEASGSDPDLLCWKCRKLVATGSKPRGRALPELYSSVKENNDCAAPLSTRLCSKHYKELHAKLTEMDMAYANAIADGRDGKVALWHTHPFFCFCN